MPGFISCEEMTEFFVDRLRRFPHLPSRRHKCEVACEIFYYIRSNFQAFKIHFGSNLNFMNVIVEKCQELINDPIVSLYSPQLIDLCAHVRGNVQSVLLQHVEAMGLSDRNYI